jgi:hypothetical protein
MTPGVVTFDYALWAQAYPNLAAKADAPLAGTYFARATLYLDNTPSSRVCDLDQRQALLFLLTAHIAKLSQMAAAAGDGPGLVGRISQATQGSVSVSADMPNQPQGAAWYQQTTYGADYWAATAWLRTAIYVPPARGPYGFGSLGPWRRW